MGEGRGGVEWCEVVGSGEQVEIEDRGVVKKGGGGEGGDGSGRGGGGGQV